MHSVASPKHYINIDNKYDLALPKSMLKSNKYSDVAASLADATSKALIADGANVDAYFKRISNKNTSSKIIGTLTALVTLFAIDLGRISKKYQLAKMDDIVENDDDKNNKISLLA